MATTINNPNKANSRGEGADLHNMIFIIQYYHNMILKRPVVNNNNKKSQSIQRNRTHSREQNKLRETALEET